MQPDLPETMRAALMDRTGEPGALRLGEVPTPRNISGEVLVKVSAAGINPIDAKTRAGGGVSSAITRYPAILGGDFSGVVVETSYTAHPLQPGDLVYGMMSVPRTQGSYAEYVAVSSLSVARRPRNLTAIEAAGVPLAALTAWGVIELAELAPGKRVLIHAGAGGVGHFAVQFAAHLGAEVVATASGRNIEWLRSLGASEVIDYKASRFEDHLTGLDAVIDLIGNVQDNTGTRSLQVLRPGGVIVNVPSGSWPTFLDDARVAGMRATTYKVNPDARVLECSNRSPHSSRPARSW
ncbi:MAG: NADP-dependent oxidoreductase [Homoserinimonas sp.]